MSPLVGSFVELFVTDGLVFVNNGCGLGGFDDLFFKECMDRFVLRVVGLGVIPFNEDFMLFFRGEDRKC